MEDNSGIFVKISNYATDIQRGKLYCQPLKYFIELEKTTGLKGQGDKLEAQIPIYQKKYFFINQIRTVSCTKTYSYENFPVFCMCFLPCNTRGIYQFTPTQVKEFSQFGNDSIAIFDGDEFIRRFGNACKRNGYEYAHSKVFYEDFWKLSPQVKHRIEENPIVSCFRKDSLFSYQNEYRFIIYKEVEEPLILEIGDISDISCLCKNCFNIG